MRKIDGPLESEGNPRWPPSKDKYIMVRKTQPDGPIYLGMVRAILKGDVGIIISLVKGFEYPNREVVPYIKASADPKKYMLVIEKDAWRYTSEEKIRDYLNKSSPFDTEDDNAHVRHEELLYETTRPGSNTLSNKYYYKATDNPYIDVPLYKVIDNQDIDDFAFLVSEDSVYTNKDTLREELLVDITVETPEDVENYVDDKVKQFRQIILKKLEGEMIEEETVPAEDNETIKSSRLDTSSIIKKMNDEPTTPQDVLIVDQAMINTFVNNLDTLEKEGEKIVRYLQEAFYLAGDDREQNSDKLYGSLRFIYYNGYVHIFRTDIPLKEVITHKLLNDTDENPKLKVLGKAEYGIPIRHNVLKYILFQNELQKNLSIDQRLLAEAELILSQEYIIALTPEPRYQIWCAVRLVKLWFGDIDLQNHIRKIKLIVNQYRTRADMRYNVRNGIRFSIGIYPRYGKKSASIVLKKIMYYFSIYFQAVGWKNNPPSYFKIVNDLVSYTNCDQSLKLYYRRVSEMNGQKNNVFSDNFTTIKSPGYNTDILEQYVKL